MGNRALLDGALYARILWFHRGATGADIDNVLKNIFDALKGVVYKDDVIITKCLAQKIRMESDFEVVESETSIDALAVLLALLSDEQTGNVLYIEIGVQTAPEVHFGEVR